MPTDDVRGLVEKLRADLVYEHLSRGTAKPDPDCDRCALVIAADTYLAATAQPSGAGVGIVTGTEPQDYCDAVDLLRRWVEATDDIGVLIYESQQAIDHFDNPIPAPTAGREE